MLRFAPLLAVGCALIVTGCNPTTVGIAASPLFVQGDQVNLLNASYAAADSLFVRVQQRVPSSSMVSMSPLEEIVDTSKEKVVRNPKLGAIMTDQLRSRFEQLGYQMTEDKAKATISGSYQVVGRNLAVRLRMNDAKTGTQIGQHDYWMPITADIRRYMDPNSGGLPIYKVREGIDGLVDR